MPCVESTRHAACSGAPAELDAISKDHHVASHDHPAGRVVSVASSYTVGGRVEKCATEECCSEDIDREDQIAARGTGWDAASRLLKAVRGHRRAAEYPKVSQYAQSVFPRHNRSCDSKEAVGKLCCK